MENKRSCPRCGQGAMRSWTELTVEEQEVVKRLPGANDYSEDERQRSHQWCSRCWHEETGGKEQRA